MLDWRKLKDDFCFVNLILLLSKVKELMFVVVSVGEANKWGDYVPANTLVFGTPLKAVESVCATILNQPDKEFVSKEDFLAHFNFNYCAFSTSCCLTIPPEGIRTNKPVKCQKKVIACVKRYLQKYDCELVFEDVEDEELNCEFFNDECESSMEE